MEQVITDDPYAACRAAINWFEKVMLSEQLERIRFLKMSVEEIVNRCVKASNFVYESKGGRVADDLAAAAPQFDTKEFRTYLRAKIYGAM